MSLIHAVLDLAMQDPADAGNIGRRARRSINWAVAILVISTPVFVWMTIHTNRMIARDPGHARSPVRKRLTYLALLVAVLIFFGDASYVVYRFLSGEMTIRFALKALTVGVIAAAVFGTYFNRDEDAENDR